MSAPALANSPTNRIGKSLLSVGLRNPALGLRFRSGATYRAILKIAATGSVLLLITAGALGLRLLLWLPHGVLH